MSRKSPSDPVDKPLPFDPVPGARLAGKALRGAGVVGALIGRVAVWQYLTDPSQRGATDEVSLAVTQPDSASLRTWLQKKGFPFESLARGGLGVRTDGGVVVNFLHHAGGRHDFSRLYADAVAQAQVQERLAQLGEETLFLAPPEHLVAMELAEGGKEHERDARRLLAVTGVDLGKVRQLLETNLGRLGVSKLDLFLLEHGGPARKAR